MFKELNVIAPPKDSSKISDLIVGIDLGTTNSLIAIVENGKPRILPSREGKNLVPSIAHFSRQGVLEIGYSAKKYRVRDPEHTVYSVKRLLGRGANDVRLISQFLPLNIEESSETNVKIRVGSNSYTPIEISAMILKELKLSAEQHLGVPVQNAVITVPAYFNDSQRQATRTAGRIAGLNVLRIVNEPTAAALAYGLQERKNGLIAVFDLGGGTFDISVLRLKDGIFEVLATNGDTQLGGDDIDQAIATWICSEKLGLANIDRNARAVLLEIAEQLKIKLTTGTSAVATEKFSLNGVSYEVSLARTELEDLTLPILERTRKPVENVLRDAKLIKADLTDVIVVGGPTRMPVVQSFIRELFEKEPNCSMNPEEVVAQGAAIQADILAGRNKDFLLLDIVPLSLGIETFGGTMSKLIARNTRIPTLAKEPFTTYVDGQIKIAINVFQGEREFVKDNRKLAEFVLQGVPPLPAGTARIEVTFLVDADGILNVTAQELYSQVEQSIEVRPSYGLTDAEVEAMLAASLAYEEEDRKKRQEVEASLVERKK